MSDTITVTFGGRDVVLNKRQTFEWIYDHDGFHFDVYHCESGWLAFLRWRGMDLNGKGDSPQAAISAVESKLKNLRAELNRILGGG